MRSISARSASENLQFAAATFACTCSGLVAPAALERVETGPAITEAPEEDGESEAPVSEDAPSQEVSSADATNDQSAQNGSSGSTATATKISVR